MFDTNAFTKTCLLITWRLTWIQICWLYCPRTSHRGTRRYLCTCNKFLLRPLIEACLYYVSSFRYCVRGTRTQPLICVECSVHYWVPCAINKGVFFEMSFVIVVDTHLPRFEALAYVLPHFDELTHVVIRASSSVCRGLLFCLRKAFIV